MNIGHINIFLISLSWLLVNRIGCADVAQNSFLRKISLFIFTLCCCYFLIQCYFVSDQGYRK